MSDAYIEKAKQLLNSKKYREAALLIDQLLAKNKENDELWYLRGLVSLKVKSYAAAHECLARAASLKRKPEYYKLSGMASMECYEFEAALESFMLASGMDKQDPELPFYISICYMFLNDPMGKQYMEKAFTMNKKRTKQLISEFYSIFFKNDKEISGKVKSELEKKIDGIKT